MPLLATKANWASLHYGCVGAKLWFSFCFPKIEVLRPQWRSVSTILFDLDEVDIIADCSILAQNIELSEAKPFFLTQGLRASGCHIAPRHTRLLLHRPHRRHRRSRHRRSQRKGCHRCHRWRETPTPTWRGRPMVPPSHLCTSGKLGLIVLVIRRRVHGKLWHRIYPPVN